MNVPKLAAALFAAAVLVASAAWAGPGHDHGEAAPVATGQALPRFAAVSETFELVGVLSGKQITLYLDRYSDNSPVRGAQIELEIGTAKFKAEKQGEDGYEVVLPEAPKPGVLPITATVMVGNEADLLAGELDIRADAHAHEHAHEHAHGHAHTHSRKEYAAWAGAGLCTLALLALGGRRVIRARSVRAGAPA
jgi:hypothetical protein